MLRRRGRPVRGMVVTGVVALLALAWLDPERFVAERNVARFAETGRIDTDYLVTLSADAVGPLLRLPEPQRSCALVGIASRLGPDDWRSANASRAAARATVPAAVDCPVRR